MGPGWLEVGNPTFLDASCAWARDSDNTFLTFEFTGIGISYSGNAIDNIPWNYTSSIDGSAPQYHAMTQQEGITQLSWPWYTSPPLSEGNHTLELTKISQGVAIDYILIQPSLTQNVKGSRLAVDDVDSQMKFSGNWQVVDTPYPNDVKIPGHFYTAYGGTTHTSNHVGDVLQFPFTGTSVYVYGFYDWTVSGRLEMSFKIDNWPVENIEYPRSSDTYGDVFWVQPNFLFYETTVPSGDHVLTINVTNIIGGQKAILDVIHYTASFDTLATMPQITVPSLNPSGSGQSTTPSSTTSADPSQSIPIDRSTNGNNTGAIAGGVVGGIVGIALIAGLAWMLLKRRRGRSTGATEREALYPPDMITEVFTPPSTTTGPTRLAWTSGAPVVTPLPVKEGKRSGDTSGSVDVRAPVQPNRDSRVEELEREVRRLARQTEELQQNAQGPPPSYD